MSAVAIIDAAGVITNIIVAGPDFELPGYTLVASDGAQIGWHWDGSAFAPPTVELDALKAGLCAEIDAERDYRIDAGFDFEGIRYQSRPGDRENIAGAVLAALAAMSTAVQPGNYRWHGGDSDFTWIAEDNSLHLMDAQTVFQFGRAALAHKQALIFEARAIKDAVATAEDEAGAHEAAEGWAGGVYA